jgi:ubiquinone/menaquinone biosynthesis C-methylase UbiE
MTESSREFLPAAGRDWALRFYDPFTRLLGAERMLRPLLDQAALRPGHRVLDVGCGTGTLAILLKRLHPQAEIVALDPDPKALALARRKAARASIQIQFDQGFGDRLPYPDAAFDRVLSSFMFHHLPGDQKASMLGSVRRVLKPGGEFHMLDFEATSHGLHGILARMLHSKGRLTDNAESRVVTFMREAGLVNPQITARRGMILGDVAFYRATA